MIGVIPRGMVDLELAHEGLTELRVVETMHGRKATMEKLSDGFIVLPGGVGTLEEMIEVISWIYLGIIRKPLGLINQDGYYDSLLALFKHSAEEGFMPEYYEKLFAVGGSPGQVLARMERSGLLVSQQEDPTHRCRGGQIQGRSEAALLYAGGLNRPSGLCA